jgi:hypothetical protein
MGSRALRNNCICVSCFGKLISLTAIILCFITPNSYGISPKDHRYNFGWTLEFSNDPRSSFLGLFNDPARDDSLSLDNKTFLRGIIHSLPAYRDSTNWVVNGRRYKLIDSDSAFISVYEPDWSFDIGKAAFILNDFKGRKRYLLNQFTMADFNKFIIDQNLSEPIDYYSLADIYIVLSNIQDYIYFIHHKGDLFIVYLMENQLNTKRELNAISRMGDRIESPSIHINGDTIMVTIFAYYPVHSRVAKLVCCFKGNELMSMQTYEEIGTEEFLKEIGYKGVKR